MELIVIPLVVLVLIQRANGEKFKLCDKHWIPAKCRVTQTWDSHNFTGTASCDVEHLAPDSVGCLHGFKPSPAASSTRLGTVSIMPFLLDLQCPGFSHEYPVPNIVFGNIKWKKLKFKMEKDGGAPVCRNLVMSASVDERALLNYDCYLSRTDGRLAGRRTHTLSVEATDGNTVDQRQFLFYIPSPQMMSANPDENIWKPFIYVENLVTLMRLHVVPPPGRVDITYRIRVVGIHDGWSRDVAVQNITVTGARSAGAEVTYDYAPTTDGVYHFVVTAFHDKCLNGVECQSVESPQIQIVIESYLYVWIIILASSALFVQFVLLTLIVYLWWFKTSIEIPRPPKVLLIYPSGDSLHAQCVASFVDLLRSEYGIDATYDGDVQTTSHCDPYFWAESAYRQATHVMYVVGPYVPRNPDVLVDIPTAGIYQDIDKLLLSFLKKDSHRKNVINVFFEHSACAVPTETSYDKAFYLLKDWQKLIAYLSKDLAPKEQLVRTDRGQCLIDDLMRVKKLLNDPDIV